MHILTELSKRGGAYVRSARRTKRPVNRDRYLELAAKCFEQAARRAQALMGRDLIIAVEDDPASSPD